MSDASAWMAEHAEATKATKKTIMDTYGSQMVRGQPQGP
jgi:hypothetical protein